MILHSHRSGSDSSSARGSHGTPVTCNIMPVLIQEVIPSLLRRSYPKHNEQSPVENTFDQPTPANTISQGPSSVLKPLHQQYTDYKMVWHSKCFRPSQKTVISYSFPQPPNQSPTSELFITYVVGNSK